MSDANNQQGSVSITPRRWLGPAFLVSLVVNLFLLGLIASAVWMNPEPEGKGPGPSLSFFGRDLSDVSKEDRMAMRNMMRGQFKIVRPYLVEMDNSRAELAKAIGATPYDAVKVRAAFTRLEEAQNLIGQTMHDALAKGFATMDDARRESLAKAMQRSAERRWDHERERRRDHGDDDDDGPRHHRGPNDRPDGPPAP